MIALADGVTVTIGHNIWSFGLDTVLYVIIAAIIGIIAEYIVGWHLPFGIIGAIIAAVVGIWLMTKVIIITGIPDYTLYNVPLLKALIGAIILVAIWHLITFGFTRHRHSPA